MAGELTERQRQILAFIEMFLAEHGYPPSVREIGSHVGLTSSSTVHLHLTTLQDKGYLRRDPAKPRAIEVCWDSNSGARTERTPMRNVPVLGQVAAGRPILAVEQVEEVYPLPAEFVGDGTAFMLRIRGDSMTGAGILDGDLVVVRQQSDAENGQVVAALVGDDEATVKRFRRVGERVVLEPENPAFAPMSFDSGVQVLGRVVSVIRPKVN